MAALRRLVRYLTTRVSAAKARRHVRDGMRRADRRAFVGCKRWLGGTQVANWLIADELPR
jgi:hypothetical protein